jgi:hypothetical protein
MKHVPGDAILFIASFLSIKDIRCLSWTCRSIRATVVTSQGATNCIWMSFVQKAFPDVFRAIGGLSFGKSNEEEETGGGHIITSRFIARNVSFAGCIQLAVCRLIGISDEINLPILAHLLPQRYPTSIIDSSTLDAKIESPFFSYDAQSKDGTTVKLIVFEGQVGTGDRCIRADQPFPIRKVFPASNRCSEPITKRNRLTLSISKLMKTTPFKLKTNDCHQQNNELDCLRPYVIPTVISDAESNSSSDHGRLLIDVTPCFAAYFEVTIMKHDHDCPSLGNTHHDLRHECIAIGLSTESFSLQGKMPGWDFESYGYHSDDGSMFHGRGTPPRRGQPSYGQGDVVGCGFHYASMRIFFVKNGQFLGYEFDKVREDFVESGLYPTVGIDTKCPIFVNFGAHPFRFDFKNIEHFT